MSNWITTADVDALDAETRSMENPRVPLDPWHQAAGGVIEGDLSAAGVRVGEAKALTVAAFWRGVSLIGRTVAKLPLGVSRYEHPGRRADPEHPADWLLRVKPNEYMTPFVWKQLALTHALLRGNAYSYIFRRADGAPMELLPLDPRRTYPVREDTTLWYVHELKGGEKRKLPARDVLHLKGLSGDGLEGYDVLHKARETLGLAVATTTYGSVFFRNSARPNVLLKFPGRMSPEARKNLKESWERMHSGLDNAHRTAILEEGGDVVPVQINARDAQLLESKQFSLIDVANWLNLPPNRLGANISTSYKSLEQDNQNFLDDCIDPWLVMIEEECEAKLLSVPQRQRGTHAVCFDRFPLVRADLQQRGAFYTQALQSGWLSYDEVRAREGINPMPAGLGRVYARPLNQEYVGGDPDGPGPAVAPGTELLDLPDVRQEQAWDCGPAALRAVLEYFGLADNDLVQGLGTTPERGTSPAQVLAYLSRTSLTTTARAALELADLTRFFQAGQPVLCPCRPAEAPGGHWVAVIGTGLGQVFLQDPMSGRRMMAEADWLAIWKDADAEGNAYERFGIAVGESLLPVGAVTTGENDPPEGGGDPAPDPSDVADDPVAPEGERAKVLLATERALGEALGRMVRRCRHRAERAARKPGEMLRWLDECLYQADVGTLEEMLAAPLAAWCGASGREAAPADVAGRLAAELRDGLLEACGQVNAAGLAVAVGCYFDGVESDVWATATGQYLTGKVDKDE